MSKFTLTVELGNDAMQSRSDLGALLINLGQQLRRHPRADRPIAADDSVTLRDVNGNRVGRYEVTS